VAVGSWLYNPEKGELGDTQLSRCNIDDFIKQGPRPWRNPLVLLLPPGIALGEAIEKLYSNLPAWKLNEDQIPQMAAMKIQKAKSGGGKPKGWYKGLPPGAPTRRTMWIWLIQQGVPKEEIDGLPTSDIYYRYRAEGGPCRPRNQQVLTLQKEDWEKEVHRQVEALVAPSASLGESFSQEASRSLYSSLSDQA
jgi:hypothetical protein